MENRLVGIANMSRSEFSHASFVGRALLEFREGPDPGGRVAARRRKAAKAEADGERLRTARPEGAREEEADFAGRAAPCADGRRGTSGVVSVTRQGMEFQTDPLLKTKVA
jgi:hypothetical protein